MLYVIYVCLWVIILAVCSMVLRFSIVLYSCYIIIIQLSVNHGLLHWWMGKVVEESQAGWKFSVYGQGQCTFPHGSIPMLSSGRRGQLYTAESYQLHWLVNVITYCYSRWIRQYPTYRRLGNFHCEKKNLAITFNDEN